MNEEQTELWNGAAGAAWVEAQTTLDELFRPFEEMLVRAAADLDARRVLDVGCGTGATTLAVARTRPGSHCTGIDVSRPMIALARARAAREGSSAQFVVGDAQGHDFKAAQFDLVQSRFGVMFFSDPVAAFANLRRASAARAALRCIAFRSPEENPFMTAAERAARPLLPELPRRGPDGPGQFAFADARKVQSVLEAAGWREVEILPVDRTCAMPERELSGYLLRLGVVGLALRDADEETRQRVLGVVRAAFAPYLRDGEVHFNAACWEIAARA